jgi:2-polyprenyl-6-methoxyphenol hydroxylase-like FAD-dependent oxidoreductase
MSISKFEICVLGGGPAGAIIGRRLAELGHNTVIIDRCLPAQPYRVESLAPPVLQILDSLALSEAVAAAIVQCERRALVRWESNSVQSKLLEFPTFLVWRSLFDQTLRELAAKVGAYLLSFASARTPERKASGGWLIPVISSEGTVSITADFLVDARGTRRGTSIHQERPCTAALSAAWNCRNADYRETRIEAEENEWLWGCPLRDGLYSATIFLDPARIAGLRENERGDLYRKLISHSELLGNLLHGEMVSRIFVRDATSRIVKDLIGLDFIRTGEAAFSIDPLSSQGVQRAILCAIQGSAAVHTIRSGQDSLAAMAFYCHRQQHAAQQASLNATRYYKESRYQTGQFWIDRGGTVNSTSPLQEPPYKAPSLLPSFVRLSDALRIVEVPVLSGNIIKPVPAFTHPRFEQPIAYMGGIALAPLAADLVDGLTREQLLTRWAERMPWQTAWYIFRWMCAYGILEPCEQRAEIL